MKKLVFFLFLGSVMTAQAQSKNDLIAHYQAYYKQMKTQGDVQGVINAMTHLNILTPSQARKDTLAYLYVNSGKHIQALNTLGIEKNPSDSDLAVEVKAVSLKAVNQPQRALEQYEVLFSRKPNPYLAYEIADLKIQTGDMPGAAIKITYGLTNAKDEMKYAYYETGTPYEVPLKAAFTYLKAIHEFNKDQKNIDAAVAVIDEALALAPNFNLANISKQALLKRKEDANKQ
ncbi:hypothetical protein GWK08_05920 [Leptobacterium flavescens]|uniref:Tetratricopeptide repeat protein n=1 Tax=Leptobacterium flavescens TaxID=472055 RepID=A0A6P0UJ17_9FLAO|nr:hypothetical protein [Leptobacterium flavescens]NER12967.1 hypothetical protein [Leptobacterium flavescens]